MRRGFTLMEILVTVVLIAVLARVAITQYSGQRELALDKEAIATLKVIKSTQRIYKMENGVYIACADSAAISNTLKVILPVANPNWNYKVDSVGASPFTFRAKAQRTSGPRIRVWCIDETLEDPVDTCTW